MPQSATKNSPLNEQQQTVQVAPYSEHLDEKTIDLYELWILIWNKKWLIIAITTVSAIGAIVYTLQLPRIYKAEALLLPPKAKDVQSMNLFGFREVNNLKRKIRINPEHNSKNVFNQFKKNLTSRALHKKFIHEFGLLEWLAPERSPEARNELFYQNFANLIQVAETKGFTSVSIQTNDPIFSSKLVNDFVYFVDKKTVEMLVDDLEHSIENEIRETKYNIDSKRLMAEKRREDQIVRYSEHAQIAKQIGMIGRVDATNIIQNTQMNVDIATTSTPLYYLGYEALMTQIKILRSRKSDDPFITGLRDLQEQLALLRTIKFDKEMMSTVTIDQKAFPPSHPIKPKRRSIVILITLVGLFSAIFLIFFIEFVKNQKEKHLG